VLSLGMVLRLSWRRGWIELPILLCCSFLALAAQQKTPSCRGSAAVVARLGLSGAFKVLSWITYPKSIGIHKASKQPVCLWL